ncbi:MAG: winged helix-turn-helix domain-containing protein [Chromatocurvus sp.]
MSDGDNPASHAFGHWRFDAATGDLFDGTATLRLEPQVARLLDYFLNHQGTLISRDELMAAVWDDRIVTDDAVNRCISILRHTLTPDERNAYIETVVRRGFISHFPPPHGETVPFQAKVPLERRALERRAPPVQEPKSRKPWLLLAIAGVATLTLLTAFSMLDSASPSAPAATPARAPMVAVLPFIATGTEEESDFFARGVHDDLLTQLAQLESIQVISRASVSGYSTGERRIGEIGRELGADAILEGTVQTVGNQIRINAQLIDARSDLHLWAEQYDREISPTNIFGIQSEIARAVASALNAALTRQDVAQLNVLPTENMAAYRAYHEALEMRRKVPFAAIDSPGYIAAMERAVALDPQFVRAWAELAGSLSYMNFVRVDPDSVSRLEQILERIRGLAPQSSELLIAQAYYTYYILRDHDRAFELINQAEAMRPSDIQILELQSWIQRRQGDFAGNINSIRKARSLDPRSNYHTSRLVSNLMLAHRYDDAIDVISGTSVDSFQLAVLHSMLQVQDHRQPARMVEELAALEREYDTQADPLLLWEAHIAARDYSGATAMLDAFEAAKRPDHAWNFSGSPDPGLARLITRRLQLEGDTLATLLAETQARLEREREAGIFQPDFNFYLAMATVTAARGSTEDTEQLVRTWRRKARQDIAELISQRHYACRVLALAGAVSATLECLRSGLAEPSRIMPFLEPLLPYYDSMREDPRFVEFLTGLRST